MYYQFFNLSTCSHQTKPIAFFFPAHQTERKSTDIYMVEIKYELKAQKLSIVGVTNDNVMGEMTEKTAPSLQNLLKFHQMSLFGCGRWACRLFECGWAEITYRTDCTTWSQGSTYGLTKPNLFLRSMKLK